MNSNEVLASVLICKRENCEFWQKIQFFGKKMELFQLYKSFEHVDQE